jgi:hypothetical protein
MMEPSAGSLSEVVHVHAIASAQARLAAASTQGPVFDAALAAFEVTRLIAHEYSRRHTSSYPMWMYTVPAACDGRDALGFAPSAPDGPLLSAEDIDLDSSSEEAVADALADLAASIAGRLRAVAAQLDTPGDVAACEHAAGAADVLHGLLAKDT